MVMDNDGKKRKRRAIISWLMIALALVLVAGLSMFFVARRVFPLEHRDIIVENAERYDVDKYLIMAIIRAESSFRVTVVSHAGAIGLMQIMPQTGEHIASRIGVEDYTQDMLYDPAINIQFGTWYISQLIEQFNGNLDTALAAYNAGRNKVRGWLANEEFSTDGENLDYIPYTETRNFVSRVNLYRTIYRILY